MPVEHSRDHYNNAKGLNEFLCNVPHFHSGFYTTSHSEHTLIDYIKEEVDPEVVIINIGMNSINGKVDWFDISNYASLVPFLSRYAADKVLHQPAASH